MSAIPQGSEQAEKRLNEIEASIQDEIDAPGKNTEQNQWVIKDMDKIQPLFLLWLYSITSM